MTPPEVDAPAVQRDIEVDLPAAEVWPLVGDGAGWVEWLVDESDVVVEPGRDGTIVDDGDRRAVHIDEVVPGESVTWSWWPVGQPVRPPTDRPDDASTVRLVVVPAGARTVVRITETRASASSHRWSLRAGLLARQAWPAPVLAAA